jgi:hypothetical protein
MLFKLIYMPRPVALSSIEIDPDSPQIISPQSRKGRKGSFLFCFSLRRGKAKTNQLLRQAQDKLCGACSVFHAVPVYYCQCLYIFKSTQHYHNIKFSRLRPSVEVRG